MSRVLRHHPAALLLWLVGFGEANGQSTVPRLELVADVVIKGNVSGPAALGHTVGLAIARDGAVFAFQPQENVFRLFDGVGRFQRVVGQTGDGPGEFRLISAFGWLSDTLWVTDGRHRRISFFSDRGQFLRSEPDSISRVAPFRSLVALLDGGRVLSTLSDQPPPDTGAPRPWNDVQATLSIQNRDGGSSRPLASFKIVPRLIHISVAGGKTRAVPDMFANNPLLAVSPRGNAIALIVQETPTGDSAAFLIRRFTSAGAEPNRAFPDKVVALPISRVATDSLFRPFGERLIRSGAITEAAYFAQIRTVMSRRPQYRAFDRAMISDDGTLWMHREGTETEWFVFGPNNAIRGKVILPRGSHPAEITSDRVWTIDTDAVDVPNLVRSRVIQSWAR